MAEIRDTKTFMRVVHRYLGYFLAGIMAIYSISGIVLIFRDVDLLKQDKHSTKTLAPDLSDKALAKEISIRNLEFTKTANDTAYFKEGWYAVKTGEVNYSKKEYPFVLNKLITLHKSKSAEPLSALNIFFGTSLLFYVISSFWMFQPKSKIFKKGMVYTLVGAVLTIILLFV